MSTSSSAARLLPWTTLDGNPCFLSGDGSGYLSRIADGIEAVQLGTAYELIGHVEDLLADTARSPWTDAASRWRARTKPCATYTA